MALRRRFLNDTEHHVLPLISAPDYLNIINCSQLCISVDLKVESDSSRLNISYYIGVITRLVDNSYDSNM